MKPLLVLDRNIRNPLGTKNSKISELKGIYIGNKHSEGWYSPSWNNRCWLPRGWWFAAMQQEQGTLYLELRHFSGEFLLTYTQRLMEKWQQPKKKKKSRSIKTSVSRKKCWLLYQIKKTLQPPEILALGKANMRRVDLFIFSFSYLSCLILTL